MYATFTARAVGEPAIHYGTDAEGAYACFQITPSLSFLVRRGEDTAVITALIRFGQELDEWDSSEHGATCEDCRTGFEWVDFGNSWGWRCGCE